MADLTLPGRIHDWKRWTYGTPPGINEDFGNQWWAFYPLGEFAATLTAEGKPQLGTHGGATGTPVASAATVAEWWNSPQNMEYTITLPEVSPGVWKLDQDVNGFHPLDGLLYGNEGAAHNYFWAWESNSLGFVYQPGQYLVWFAHNDSLAYINGQKVLHRKWGDGGGANPAAVARVDLDTLGLTPGQTYPLRMFIASRENSTRVYFETNIPIGEEYVIALSQWIIGSGTVTPAAGAYDPGWQTITATPNDGYELASLTVDGSPITSGDTLDLQTHSTVAAVFTRLQNNTRVCTRDHIIAAALRKCQVLAEGELPTNDQIHTGAEALERFMKHMQTDTEFRWLFVQRTQVIAADEQEVVLTGSSDILDIYNLFLRDSTNQDIPLRLVDAHWYDSTLQFKSTSDALPAVALAKFWRDPATNVAQVSLSIYPKPAQAYTLYYRVMAKYYNLNYGTDELLQDEIWCDVVVYGLAARLADEYNRTERAVYLEQKFEKLKDAAKRKSSSTRDSLTVFSV